MHGNHALSVGTKVNIVSVPANGILAWMLSSCVTAILNMYVGLHPEHFMPYVNGFNLLWFPWWSRALF